MRENVGVKFNRDYKAIVSDLAEAILTIEDGYEAFEMTAEDWRLLSGTERLEFMRTFADDLFYGLGQSPSIPVGSGKIEYVAANHIIKIHDGDNVVHIVQLI